MDTETLRRKIAFIDVEASGLMTGAFPVEVAWQTDEGKGEALLDPSGHWDESRWDPDAQAMHGIALPELRRRGRHPRVVAASLEAALAGRLVFSDSPAHDMSWIDMVHSAGDVKRTYRIETVGRLIGHLGVSASRAYGIFDAVRRTHPPRGRARQGVAYISAVFETALNEVSR